MGVTVTVYRGPDHHSPPQWGGWVAEGKGHSMRFRSITTAVLAATAIIGATSAVPAATAATDDVPGRAQAIPITNFNKACTVGESVKEGYPQWHYGETARRYEGDGTIQFKNTTDQEIDYTATVETGTNHQISSNSRAALPSGWDTTAKSDIGLKESNGWLEGETIGPVKLKPGESFRVEYGTLIKDFVAVFQACENGTLGGALGADVIRGTGPAERYASAYVVHADGSISDKGLNIPSRGPGAASRLTPDDTTNVYGPSLEKVADPEKDYIKEPDVPVQRDPSWPKEGGKCAPGDHGYYPLDITTTEPTIRKPGFSQSFLNWSSADYEFKPTTDNVVGAWYTGQSNWNGTPDGIPDGWLASVGVVGRAYMPVGTALKPVDLKAGEKVRVEYGTTLTRINYREFNCSTGKPLAFRQASAPSGFWAEAVVTAKDGSTRTLDITPDEWRDLPVPTQTNRS